MKKYLITSREFYTDTPAVFRSILRGQLQTHMPAFALYRDKSNPDYDVQAEDFVDVCNGFSELKSFIHQKVDLAKRVGAVGVHLTSKQFDEISHAKELGLEVIISTHTLDEVKLAKELGAKYVTFSPIFKTPHKGPPKGIDDLSRVVDEVDINIFALGGIVSEDEVEQIKKSRAYGFASIRYFYG